MAKIKYLIETSALPPALNNSTPAQHRELLDIVGNGELYTSTYIRMEFVRRWICGMLRMASLTYMHSSVETALSIIEQSFSARDSKSGVAFVRRLLRHHGTIAYSVEVIWMLISIT